MFRVVRKKASLFAALGCLLLVGPAQAKPAMPSETQKKQTTDKMQKLNGEAIAAFEGYSYGKGRQLLSDALELAANAHIDQGPILATTHILLGIAWISGKSDTYRGLHAFVNALRIDRSAEIPKRLASPRLQRVFAIAERAVKTLGSPPKVAVWPKKVTKTKVKLDTTARGLEHSPIDEARAGYPISVRAVTGADVRAHRLVLFYRGAGKVKYQQVVMSKSGNTYRGSIPPAATEGRYIHYYIQAVDERGRVAAKNGSARGPNVVTLKN
ncbi:MAG: hypothetical protein H6707_06100 [Deltaproteobacteria bacterium]|nr:hypothetical protein [Deltaproteobacteria bacterium]